MRTFNYKFSSLDDRWEVLMAIRSFLKAEGLDCHVIVFGQFLRVRHDGGQELDDRLQAVAETSDTKKNLSGGS